LLQILHDEPNFATRYNTLAPGSAGHVTMQRTVSGSVDRFLHYDHIGNVILESNTSGAFATEHEQDAFGRPVLSDAAGGWDHNSLHQTTKHWDDSTGLFYFNARWYDPATGTFLSAASVRRMTEHPYGFSINNPLISMDVSGHLAMCNGQVVSGGNLGGTNPALSQCGLFLPVCLPWYLRPSPTTFATMPGNLNDEKKGMCMYRCVDFAETGDFQGSSLEYLYDNYVECMEQNTCDPSTCSGIASSIADQVEWITRSWNRLHNLANRKFGGDMIATCRSLCENEGHFML
jgi:RHS repeat-associated protein